MCAPASVLQGTNYSTDRLCLALLLQLVTAQARHMRIPLHAS